MKLGLIKFAAACALGSSAFAGGHAAPSTFQNTCSNIEFVYEGNEAAISAVCLRSDGTPHASAFIIPGISNQNGVLTAGEGASTFQQSCGDITIEAEVNNVTLSANCRMGSGESNETSIEILGVGNIDGNLSM